MILQRKKLKMNIAGRSGKIQKLWKLRTSFNSQIGTEGDT